MAHLSQLFISEFFQEHRSVLSPYLQVHQWACWHLVLSSPEPGSRDIQVVLGTNEPVAAQILAINKHYSFTPILWTQRHIIHDKFDVLWNVEPIHYKHRW